MAYVGLSEHVDFEKLPDPSGRLRLDEVIGEGTYGEVYQAFDLETGTFSFAFPLSNFSDV